MKRGDFLKSLLAIAIAPKLLFKEKKLVPLPRAYGKVSSITYGNLHRVVELKAGESMEAGDMVAMNYKGECYKARPGDSPFGLCVQMSRYADRVYVEY